MAAYRDMPTIYKPRSHKILQTVIFLCTGNYYRSRFAEEVFNYRAAPGRTELGGPIPRPCD